MTHGWAVNCEHCSMHPLHLGFLNTELERRYISSRNHHLAALYDEASWWIHAVMNMAAFWIVIAADADCWLLLRLVAVATLVHKLVFRFVARGTYLK
jgi:hypothetical protein